MGFRPLKGGGGTPVVPDLQQVTTVGNITTNDILFGGAAYARIGKNPSGTEFAIGDSTNGFFAFFNKSLLTANQNFSFPDKTGTLALAENFSPSGNILYVSDAGSSTQTRNQGLGQIYKPFTFSQASAECISGDTIIVLSYSNLGVSGNFSSKNGITIVILGNSFAGSATVSGITIQNLGANCTISSLGGSYLNFYASKNRIFLNAIGANSRINNVYIESNGNLTLGANCKFCDCILTRSNIIAFSNTLQFDKCLIDKTSAFNLSFAGSGVASSNLIFNQCRIAIGTTNTTNVFTITNCQVFFQNETVLESQSGSTQPIFSNSTGNAGAVNLFLKNSYIFNQFAQITVDVSAVKIPRFELINSYYLNPITLGRIPTLVNAYQDSTLQRPLNIF
ncbi:MAG: hypothetical protein MUC49_02370 [Raineya sp.]|jgi:hypothetical protein|nr:hypothetical protein [Raineya sp.]